MAVVVKFVCRIGTSKCRYDKLNNYKVPIRAFCFGRDKTMRLDDKAVRREYRTCFCCGREKNIVTVPAAAGYNCCLVTTSTTSSKLAAVHLSLPRSPLVYPYIYIYI